MAPITEGGSYRQHTRLLLAIPITVVGKDGLGRPHQEDTKTVDVGKRGARIPLLLALPANAGIGVRSAAGGEAHAARVVWCGAKKDFDGRTEIGIEFIRPLDAERLWAIQSPPNDWQNGQLTLSPLEKLEFIAERSQVPGQPRENFPFLPEAVPAGKPEDWTGDVQPLIFSEPVINGAEEARTGAPLKIPVAVVPIGVAPSSPPVDSASVASTSVRDAGQNGIITPPVQGEKQDIRPSKDSTTELAARLAEILSERASASLPAADAAAPVQEAAQKAVDDLRAARKQIEEGLRTSGQLYQKELAAIGDASIERLRGSSQRLVATFRDELEKALDELERKAKAVGTVKGAEKDAVAKLQNLSHEMEKSLHAAYTDNQKQLAALGAASLEDLDRKSQAMLEGFQAELEKARLRLEDTAAGAVGHQFTKQVSEFRGDLLGLRREQEHRLLSLREQMMDHVQESVSSVKPPPPFDPRTLVRPVVWTASAVVSLLMMMFLVFVYSSTVRVWHLHEAPPAEFTQTDPSWNPARLAVEQQLQQDYWSEALHALQKIYPYGTDLPEQPPPEFWLDPQKIEDPHLRPNSEAMRLRYWQILRRQWNDPRNWDESYEWNTKSVGSKFEPLGEVLRKIGS